MCDQQAFINDVNDVKMGEKKGFVIDLHKERGEWSTANSHQKSANYNRFFIPKLCVRAYTIYISNNTAFKRWIIVKEQLTVIL